VAALTSLARDSSDSVRTGVLLALRRLHSPEVATFLQDANPQLVLEAARAIHDEPIEAALPRLARWAGKADLPAPVSRRAINAAYRLGGAGDATALAKLAAEAKAPELSRIDAIEALGQWNTDLGRDRVLGLYRPLPATRIASAAAAAISPLLEPLLGDASDAIRAATAEAAGALGLMAAEPALLAMTKDEHASGPVRLAALKALATLNSARLTEAIAATLHATDAPLTKEARRLAAAASPDDALAQATAALDNGTPAEKQSAFQVLATAKDHEADKLIAKWLDRLAGGKVPPEAQLELLEAAAKKTDKRV
jgi:quinoprotein glucose dehydrogenase